MSKKNKTNEVGITTAEAAETLLKWRLKGAPTLEDVTTMLDKGIISKDEARQILFSELDKDGVNKAKDEQIEFLKDIIDRLSKQPPQVVWNYIQKFTPSYGWGYGTYTSPVILCSSVGALANNASTSGNTVTYTMSTAGTGGTFIQAKALN